jgi:CRP-like cAMP-binding protein
MIVDERIIQKCADSSEPKPYTVQTLVDRLQYHDFFKLFPPNVRADLFNKAVYKSYHCGDLVYARGDTDVFMGVVMSGRLRVSMTTSDGKGVLLGLVERGEVFGETALMDGLPRTADAHAEDETTLMIIKHEDFIPALMANPEAMMGIIKMLCHRLRLFIDTIDMIALQNLPARLARYLLRLAGEYGTIDENGHIVVRAGLNQSSIGQQLATSRESINKQLKAFVGQNLITMRGEEIIITNPEGLWTFAG